MSDFTEYATRIQDYDNNMYLGRLVYYAITENSHVPHNEFCRALIENGLNGNLPPVPRTVDVFRRSCTAAQQRRVPTIDPNTFINYNIREVGKDPGNVWRTLVAETVDTTGHTLGYQEIAIICYNRTNNSVYTDKIDPPTDDPTADQIVQNVIDNFVAWNNLLTPYAVREFVRRTLRSLNATAIRDGVYFIRETHADKINALETVIAGAPGGSFAHSLPLIDDRKQRDMLRKAFEEESTGEIDRLLGEVSEIMASEKKISSDRFADFKVSRDQLQAKMADYSELLSDSMNETVSRIELMDQALFALLGKVKA